MKRTLLTLALLVVLITGCPGAVEPQAAQQQPVGRTTVADARLTCARLGFLTIIREFDASVELTRLARGDGAPASEMRAGFLAGCRTNSSCNGSPSCISGCGECFTAVVAAVYAEPFTVAAPPDPVIVEVPVFVPVIVEPPPLPPLDLIPDCPLICDVAGFCDSDCDGYDDAFELASGNDPCDSFDLPCPSASQVVRVCAEIVECDSLNEPPPPTFVSGDVFSFLTATETDVFLARVAFLNSEIDELIENELAHAQGDLQRRGLATSTLWCNVTCESGIDSTRLKRQATFDAIDLALSGTNRVLVALDILEIFDFNCREYPNRTFICSLAERGLFDVTCTIDLPCGG